MLELLFGYCLCFQITLTWPTQTLWMLAKTQVLSWKSSYFQLLKGPHSFLWLSVNFCWLLAISLFFNCRLHFYGISTVAKCFVLFLFLLSMQAKLSTCLLILYCTEVAEDLYLCSLLNGLLCTRLTLSYGPHSELASANDHISMSKYLPDNLRIISTSIVRQWVSSFKYI